MQNENCKLQNETIEVNANTLLAIRSPVPLDMLLAVQKAIVRNLGPKLEALMRQQGDWFIIETTRIDKIEKLNSVEIEISLG